MRLRLVVGTIPWGLVTAACGGRRLGGTDRASTGSAPPNTEIR
jgi:hypothetical protein